MQQFKKPAVITTLIANFVILVGGLIGWFTLSATLKNADNLTGNLIQSSLNDKKTISIVVGIISIALTLIIVKFHKRWLQVIPFLLDAFILFDTFNQHDTISQGSNLGIHASPGYWLSLIGSIVATVGCIWIIATLKKSGIDSPLPNQTPALPIQGYNPAVPVQPVASQPLQQMPPSPIPNYGGIPGVTNNVTQQQPVYQHPPVQPVYQQSPQPVAQVVGAPTPNSQPVQPENITNLQPPVLPPQQ